MKKTIFFVLVMIFSLSAFAAKTDPKTSPDNVAVPNKTENKLSDEEISRLTKRVEEIRDMDKTGMAVKEKRALKKELKGIKENVRKNGGVIYISAGTLVLIIILVLLLA
jgi:hypothetical protein